jgi:hypothetical protein
MTNLSSSSNSNVVTRSNSGCKVNEISIKELFQLGSDQKAIEFKDQYLDYLMNKKTFSYSN